MKKLFIYIFFILLATREIYSKDILLADVVESNIKIRTSFSGAEIFIYGSIESQIYDEADILIVVRGPDKNFAVRKKYKKFGIWIVELDKINFKNMPSYYAISSSRKLDSKIYKNLFIKKQIGWENLNYNENINSNDKKRLEFYKALEQNLIKKGLLLYKEKGIAILNKSLFKAVFNLPELTPTGIYNINTYLIGNNGHLIAEWTNSIEVSKEGIAEELYNFSQNQSLMYGFFAAFAAIIAGLLASEVFRRI